MSVLFLAAELVESVAKAVGVERVEILGSVKGQALELVRFNHPFYDFTVPVILGDHVTTDGGTGLVHTAPDHGLDDFIVGQKYNIPMAGLVANDGKFISTTEFFAGKGVFEANPLVVEKLQEVGNLLKVEKSNTVTHIAGVTKPRLFSVLLRNGLSAWNTRVTPTSIRRNQRRTLDSRLGSSTYRKNG